MALPDGYWQSRLDAAVAELAIVDAAISALASGGIQSYRLDTGQTSQTVTKLDLEQLRARSAYLENKAATLEARISGASIQGRPAW